MTANDTGNADDPGRLEELARYEILDTDPEPNYDRFTQFAARILKCPISLISFVTDDRQFFKSQTGLPEPWASSRQTGLSHSVCQHVVRQKSPLVISDTRKESYLCDNLAIPDLKVIAYLGIPITTPKGTILGSFCAIDAKPRDWTPEDIQYLLDLSAFLVSELELRRKLREEIRLSAALTEAKTVAENANRAKTEFFVNLNHEIRTPLSAISGYCDILVDPTMPAEESAGTLRSIQYLSRHLLDLLKGVLDLSQVETGQMSPEWLEVSPTDLITVTYEVYRTRAKQLGLTFTVRADTPIPRTIRTDPTRLQQILFNLMSNALKFTEAGEIRIELSMTDNPSDATINPDTDTEITSPPVDAPAAWLNIVVADQGAGLTPEQISKLFEPFVQADHSIHRRYGGSGLGLSLSRKLASLLGGTLTAAAAPNRGSRFTVRLPVSAAEARNAVAWNFAPLPSSAPANTTAAELDRRAEPPQSPSISTNTNIAAKPKTAASGKASARMSGTVLLAEDGVDNQKVLSYFVRSLGLQCTTVNNGDEAVSLALEMPFDLILMDIQMPVMNGLEAARALRNKGFARPIIALTARNTLDERALCLEAGCDDFLTKPVDRAKLAAIFRQYVKNPASPSAGSNLGSGAPKHVTTPANVSGKSPSSVVESARNTAHAKFLQDPNFQALVKEFLTKLPGQLGELRNAFEQAEIPKIIFIAHKLAGAGGMYGFENVTKTAQSLEKAAKANHAMPTLRHCFTALERNILLILPQNEVQAPSG